MRRTLRNTAQCCCAAVGAVLILACRLQRTAATGADPDGVYALVSVDGKCLPATVSHGKAELQVRSGSFSITADGTCSSKITMVPPSGKAVTREVSATYTKDGSKLKMRWKGAGRTVGTIDGRTFTMENEGMVFVYKR